VINLGSPGNPVLTSTQTGSPSIPSTAPECTLDNIVPTPQIHKKKVKKIKIKNSNELTLQNKEIPCLVSEAAFGDEVWNKIKKCTG
jgi:hypothetical protein